MIIKKNTIFNYGNSSSCFRSDLWIYSCLRANFLELCTQQTRKKPQRENSKRSSSNVDSFFFIEVSFIDFTIIMESRPECSWCRLTFSISKFYFKNNKNNFFITSQKFLSYLIFYNFFFNYRFTRWLSHKMNVDTNV